MRFGQFGRLVVVVAVVSALLIGVSAQAVGAATDKEYSQDDCGVVQSIEIDSSSGSGYYGATARKASKAFADAADDVEDDGLQSAFGTLSRVYGAAGRAHGAIGAAKALAKATKNGKAYTKALETWTGALGSCATSSLSNTTSTTESDDE